MVDQSMFVSWPQSTFESLPNGICFLQSAFHLSLGRGMPIEYHIPIEASDLYVLYRRASKFEGRIIDDLDQRHHGRFPIARDGIQERFEPAYVR